MCGIAGIIPAPSTHLHGDHINKLLCRLHHRGPDDQGVLRFARGQVWRGRAWQDGETEAALLHWRLSILDLSETGWQPMTYGDGRYYIIYNGEIYNYLELRPELEALGHRFVSQSDTEVLLAAYAQWGAQALNRLVGMFALAILDTGERRLFLARDFFGIKPLYYTFATGGFAFASEIPPLLDLPGVSRLTNPQRLFDYVRFGLTDHGGETLFADIFQLPSAHYMEVPLDHPRSAQPVRYWDVDLSQRADVSLDEAAARVRDLFLENIRLHLRSDVPVGAALSGGIDSSAVVASMRCLEGQNLDIRTFSYIADYPAISEERWVDILGQAAGAVVQKTRPQADELVADLDALISSQGEPFGSTSIYAQYRVFRLAHEAGIKVMLDGQGADELLGGYRPYVAARLSSLVRQGKFGEARRLLSTPLPDMNWKSLATQSAGFLLPTNLQAPLRRWIGKDLMPTWANADWFDARGVTPRALNYAHGKDVLRDHLYRTLTETSLPALLRYEDHNSMAFSIESRVPFLTPALVNFVLSLPESYIIGPDGTSKRVFRQAMRGIVPDAILDRRDKIGFQTPESRWLTTLQPWVERALQSEAAASIPVLKLAAIEQDWRDVIQRRRPFDTRVWRWVNLIEWTRAFDVKFN
jgi:asparagine synthase (glutamine-hydrolysing)